MTILHLKVALKSICAAQLIQLFSCQPINSLTALKINSEKFGNVYQSALPANTDQFLRNEIPVRAVRSLLSEFKNVEEVDWGKINNGGYIADIKSDSIKTRVFYDSKGRCRYIMKKYSENKMPSDMRVMVKNSFPDHTIIEITEIILPQNRDEIVYKVLIKNATNFKILRIINMEMEITDNYNN